MYVARYEALLSGSRFQGLHRLLNAEGEAQGQHEIHLDGRVDVLGNRWPGSG